MHQWYLDKESTNEEFTYEEVKTVSLQFKKSEKYIKEMLKNDSTTTTTTRVHPGAVYTSRLLTLQIIEETKDANNPAIVFNSQDFTSLSENQKIVEWGVAKLENNIQTKNVLYWTDENFKAFKESIERLSPLIRFFNISLVDFYHKVKPFARILPGTLYEDLLHHYLVPGSKDENTPVEDQLRNDFQLLLRGSQDGFTPADFHRLCGDKGATVSVIKVKGTGQVIGGYNPQSWHSRGENINGRGIFIFSLGDCKAGNSKLSKFVGIYGTFGEPNHGPQFNANIRVFGDDFKNSPGCYCQKTTEYEHAIMPGSEKGRNIL
ncbi:hypothetical protein G9A89_020228 [Geosiphon pyriformis]|nr:hypothetical protein G9A89_020228 [Geosiphon pyriformis]